MDLYFEIKHFGHKELYCEQYVREPPLLRKHVYRNDSVELVCLSRVNM